MPAPPEGRADVNIKTTNGDTALIVASQKGHLDVVRVLLAAKADVDAKMNDGTTALNAAGERVDIRELLMQAGAKP